ncbi:serine hydrolase domain-containing protein [Pseudoalteromonas umbrosa]|uniref:serine hydrolase domain-containing protein n=1 Tax=Pseudoalteromonas umbrosa TaxID=3048489 RepID=UPI0024C2DC03|nr:serine hydrolase domain-containing protein [Pseudoalteromonas sp. B95]MDK1289864.1 serine hydrolase domain-containing protein [Pseudoalteromonas sp. B95]
MKKSVLSICLGLCAFTSHADDREFDAVLQCHSAADEPGLIVQLVQSDEVIYSGAAGLADLKTKRPLKINDVMQIGSVTKMFTAAAILKLAENNTLSLQDPIGKFIPDINPKYRGLTLFSLLTHTSGLSDYLGDPTVNNVWGNYASLDKVIKIITRLPLSFNSGDAHVYSNLGYILLGKAIEVSAGMPYNQYMQDTFFKPLGMDNTFVVTQGIRVNDVVGYTTNFDAPKKHIKAEKSKDRAWKVDRSWIHASGAIASTLQDMKVWNKALMSGQVVSEKSLNLMTQKVRLNDNSTVNYGLGLNVFKLGGEISYNHAGMVPGFFTWHVYLPEHDLVATGMSNQDKYFPGLALLDMVAITLELSPKPIKDEDKITSLAEKLVGDYRSIDSQTLSITFENNRLYSQHEGEEKRLIIPRENNAYSYECTEHYFTLRENANKIKLVPTHLIHGEQAAYVKL